MISEFHERSLALSTTLTEKKDTPDQIRSSTLSTRTKSGCCADAEMTRDENTCAWRERQNGLRESDGSETEKPEVYGISNDLVRSGEVF